MKKSKNLGLVSIIMPSYNTAKYIKESIDSILNQTYDNWELLIVDDCSNDGSNEIIKSYLKDKRIKYFKNAKNSGAALSRNKAIREAKGKWVAFLDSDDLWEPTKLEKQLLFMIKNKYSFSYTKYNEIDENSAKIGKVISGPRKINKFGMFCYCWPGCLTVMYNADLVGLIQIGDIKKNNDYAMWLQICKKFDCYLLNETLSHYRKRIGSISNSNPFRLIKWHYFLFKDIEKYNFLYSSILSFNNIVWGIYKKIFYVHKDVQ